MKNSKGFTLLEVMISLLLFSVAAGTLLPAIVNIQQERQAIRYERIGEEILLSHYYMYFFEEEIFEEKHVHKLDMEYTIYVREAEQKKYLCVDWEAVNGRAYERCLEG